MTLRWGVHGLSSWLVANQWYERKRGVEREKPYKLNRRGSEGEAQSGSGVLSWHRGHLGCRESIYCMGRWHAGPTAWDVGPPRVTLTAGVTVTASREACRERAQLGYACVK
eukprot:359116-Chlamydomonas_euryale.AAC.9